MRACRKANSERKDWDAESQDEDIPKLTDEQRALVALHIGLVGVHLRTHVPTPRAPNRHREYEDLFQEGCVALIRAAARYRPGHHIAFAAYALPRIRAAIHRAIFNQFTVVYVPTRAIKQTREQALDPKLRPPNHVQGFTSDIQQIARAPATTSTTAECIRHVLRRRYELAIRRALEQMQARSWPRRNPCAIMRRIARERLLINEEAHRTPLRRIARDAGVSSGRASDYEKQFLHAIRRWFESDTQVRLLDAMACEDDHGLDAPMDATRVERLAQAEIAAFEQRFSMMDALNQAQAIYHMIERSADSLPEVARNLFCLSMAHDELAELPAA